MAGERWGSKKKDGRCALEKTKNNKNAYMYTIYRLMKCRLRSLALTSTCDRGGQGRGDQQARAGHQQGQQEQGGLRWEEGHHGACRRAGGPLRGHGRGGACQRRRLV